MTNPVRLHLVRTATRPEPGYLEVLARLSREDLALIVRLAHHLQSDPYAHFLRSFIVDLVTQDREA